MNKFRYVITSFNSKYKNLAITSEIKYQKIVLFVDYIFAAIIHGCSPADYFEFEFYNKKHKLRKTFCCNRYKRKFFNVLNDKQYTSYFSDKVKFLNKFNDFTKREWLDCRTCSFDEFDKFCSKHKVFIVKPISLSCGRGIVKDYASENLKEQYEKLKNDGCLIEEVLIQNEKLAQFNYTSVNSIRVSTSNYKGKFIILGCVLRCGSGSGCVDNYCNGGLACKIDPETGIVISDGLAENQQRYFKHPTSNVCFHGFQIPHWSSVLKMVKEAVKVVPQIQYTGWDVCIRENDVCLIEGNNEGMFNILQAPANKGFKKEIKEILNS